MSAQDLHGFTAYDPGRSEPSREGLYDVLWHFNGRDTLYGGTAEWRSPAMWVLRDTPGGAVVEAFRYKGEVSS